LTIETVTLQIVAIPGHSLAQVGVVIDDVCFAADGFFGAAVLRKYGLPYAHDVQAQLASFDVVRACDVTKWIPGHGELQSRESIAATIDANRESIHQGMVLIREACATPASTFGFEFECTGTICSFCLGRIGVCDCLVCTKRASC
jgi:glyoxylase-like metal-dependent hydrolase (beta-lactamase superfamily II)